MKSTLLETRRLKRIRAEARLERYEISSTRNWLECSKKSNYYLQNCFENTADSVTIIL